MDADLQIALLALVIVLLVAIYWVFRQSPDGNSSGRTSNTISSKENSRRNRDDFVSDHYLNRRFGKRK